MPTLTQQELDELEALIPEDEESYTPQDAINYYTYLSNKGFTYADLALQVVQNSTSRGKIVNAFAEISANQQGIEFDVGGDSYNEMRFALMQEDFAQRVANSGADLIWEQYDDIHAIAFDVVGLSRDTFMPSVVVNQVMESNPTLADAIWEDLITDSGFFDNMFTEGLYSMGMFAEITLDQPWPDLQEDIAARAKWYADAALAFLDVGSEVVDDVLPELDFEDLFDDLTDLENFTLMGPGSAPQPWLEGLLDIPGLKDLPGFIGGALTPFDDAKTTGSPLVVDLDSDGIELTAFNASTTATFFDLDGDGFAEQTAWVSADDALLVRDLDESGTIDDVTELFGSPTVDGFALLAELDSNGDLVIDANDTDWGDLRLWQDANGDAITQDGELLTLASLDIVSISLLDVAASTSTINGNPISHTSTFKYDNGSTDTIADAWFVHDNVNTYYTAQYDLDVRSLFLPSLRGFGKLPDLHIALSSDATLLGLVEDFATDFDWDIFDDLHDLDGDVEDILYRWAGVDAVSPTSRGGYVDAQHLEFLEEYFGEEWFLFEAQPNPGVNAGALLEQSWDAIFEVLKGQLLMQAGADALFDNTIVYNAFTGELEGTFALSQAAVDDLVDYATDAGVSTLQYWLSVAEFIDATMGLSNLTGTEEGWLDTALDDSGLSETWEDVEEIYLNLDTTGSTITGDSSNETINGTGLDDTLTGGGGTDTINGGDGDDWIRSHTSYETAGDQLNGGNGHDLIEGSGGDDTIDGGAGADEIYGGSGDDEIGGGTGGDYLEGGAGDDTYVYTGGDDIYKDNHISTADKILLPAGIDSNDLSYARVGAYSLLITVGTLGTIQVEDQLNLGSAAEIETIEFNDTSTLDLSTIDAPETHGTDGDDDIEGITAGAGEDDVIYGYGGDDEIDTNGGDNWVDGGTGNDEIRFTNATGGETNTVLASPGFDTVVASALSDDILLVPDAYTDDDVSLFRYVASPNDLNIHIEGLGQILVTQQFYGAGSILLDEIQFEDASPTIDLSTVQYTLHGTSGNDTLNGVTNGAGSEDDILIGYDGDDTLSAAAGDDELYGGAGDDTIYGATGDDLYFYEAGDDWMQDSSGSADILEIADSWTLDDLSFNRYWATKNDLTIEIDASNSITIDNQFYTASYEFETLRMNDGNGDLAFDGLTVTFYGSSANNTMQGSDDRADIIFGDAGNDTLYGYDGADTLYGEDGNDILFGYEGNDVLVFSAGLDTVYDNAGTDILHIAGGTTINDISIANHSSYDAKIVVTASTDEVTVDNLRHGNSTYHIETLRFDDGFETDQLTDYNNWYWGTGSGETLTGTSGDNVLIGKDGADTIDAGDGADDAHGGDGADTLNGEGGADLLHGGAGDDVLYGDDGLDTLYGGAGADTFMFEDGEAFNDVDVVKDFDISTDNDVLDLSDILDATSYNHGVDTLTDWVMLADSGSNTAVSVDRDGTGGTYSMEQVATLEGITGLTDEAALVTSGNLVVV